MRTQLVVGFALAALTASALAACSSTPPDPYAQVGEYCAAYAKGVCAISSTCQFDPTACITYQTGQCNQMATQAASSGKRAYTSSNVQACLDALNSAYGSGKTTASASTLASLNATCARVFVGTATEGASCTSQDDCASSKQICATAPNQPNACAIPTPKDLNAACADPGDQCPANAYCSAATVKCTAAQATGQSCSAATPCTSADQCLNGTCQPLGSIGAACTTSADCSPSLFCDTYTSTSAPTPVCVTSLTFARGSVDCLGIEGQSTGFVPGDAGSD